MKMNHELYGSIIEGLRENINGDYDSNLAKKIYDSVHPEWRYNSLKKTVLGVGCGISFLGLVGLPLAVNNTLNESAQKSTNIIEYGIDSLSNEYINSGDTCNFMDFVDEVKSVVENSHKKVKESVIEDLTNNGPRKMPREYWEHR